MQIQKDGYTIFKYGQNNKITVSVYKFNEEILNKIKNLDINKISFEPQCDIDDFSFLTEFEFLEDVVIPYNHKRINIEFVSKLRKLKFIGLPEFDGSICNANIKELGYKWNKKSDICSSCENLEDITVMDCKDFITLFSQLSYIKKLSVLTFFKGNLKTFEQLLAIENLEKLTLHYCSKLENFNSINTVSPNLKYLELDHVSKVEDYKEIGNLSHLEILIIGKSAPITDLDFIGKLKKLRDLRIVSTSILTEEIDVLRYIPKISCFETGIDKYIDKLKLC
jgi:Leucine-rich repeat (LRR) protein